MTAICDKSERQGEISRLARTCAYSYSTTDYSYVATDCDFGRRRHAGDRSTTDSGGVPYYGYRFYNPELGRWINRDPIGERGGVNTYRFVGNNAIAYTDYLGQLKNKPGPDQSIIVISYTDEDGKTKTARFNVDDIEDMATQIEDGLGDCKISKIDIKGHGNSIGSDIISKNIEELADVLERYIDENSETLLTGCETCHVAEDLSKVFPGHVGGTVCKVGGWRATGPFMQIEPGLKISRISYTMYRDGKTCEKKCCIGGE
jgi:RHS repeat-associated protein